MKKSLLIIFSAALLFASCSKSSSSKNNNVTSTIDISGKWYVVNDTLIDRNNGVTTEYDGTASGYTFDGSYFDQYNADNTGLSSDASFVTQFTYTVKNSLLTVNTPKQTIVDPNSGSTVSIDASTENATIRTLTSTTMVLYYDDKFSGGEDIETTYFSKIKP